jgi:hypothetical protein
MNVFTNIRTPHTTLNIPPFAKARPTPKTRNKNPLVGTARKPGWVPQARALRAFLKALYSQAPADSADYEHAGWEAIDHVDRLDAKARHIYRFVFCELIKLSRR